MAELAELPRRANAHLEELMRDDPVIAVHGPRSVGKSTVLRRLAQSRGSVVVDFDDIAMREAALGNLTSLSYSATPLCVDEYQRVPEILDAIKARLNAEGSRPGTSVITGSTRQDALPLTAQALTGRLHVMNLWPLSQGEIDRHQEDFLQHLLVDPSQAALRHAASSTSRREYVERVLRGGFPLAVKRSPESRARWFDGFLSTSIERDARELRQLPARQMLAEVLTHLVAGTGQLFNAQKIATALDVPRSTVEGHVRLLEDLFLCVRLPAWGTSLRARVNKRPKMHIVDSGLAAHVGRLTAAKLERIDPAALTDFGHVLETFVVSELRKQASWLQQPVSLGHWRTSDGAEVDVVLECFDGDVFAFQVKANERAQKHDFRGLAQLREALGSKFRAGIVFTTGARSYTYDDRLYVLPIDTLWSRAAV